MKTYLLCLLSSGCCGVIASAQLISVDFESDSSSDFTVVQGAPVDSTIDFTFDYIAAGIPLAPRSTVGERLGLRMTANDAAGASDTVTAYHNTPVAASSYSFLVDMWLNVEGAIATGTTEFGLSGVGGDGTSLNTPDGPSGSGSFLAITGDGGSSRDYRWFKDGSMVFAPDPGYQAGSQNGSDAFYLALFPGGDFPGSPANRWTTLRIDVDGSDLTYSLDGTPVVIGTATLPGDFVSLGYVDLFSSIANPFQAQFGLYDNLEVRVDTGTPTIPEPAAAFSPFVLLGVMSLLLGLRHRRRGRK